MVSLFDTGATISRMLKECLNKLDPRPLLITKHPYRGNGLGPLSTATCILEFPKKCQQQFIKCEHLLRPIFLGLDFFP